MRKKYILALNIVMAFSLSVFLGCNAGEKKNALKAPVASSCTAVVPPPKGYTNDFEKIFTKEEILALDSIIIAHEKITSNQISIVTIDSAMLGSCTLFDYSLKMAKLWGIGKKNKDNGVLIAISIQTRNITIQNGFGIEKKLSNAETKQIIETRILPQFENGNYFEGAKAGLLSIIEKIK